MKLPIAGCTLFLGVLTLALTAAGATDDSRPDMSLFGNYELSPGQILTGGPFEDGQILLMDGANLSAGGVFIPDGPDAYRSIFPPGVRLGVTRAEDGSVTGIEWQVGDGPPVHAPRVYPHHVEDISFTSSDAKISGTLFVPATPGPHPCIVFVHGSGDMDRYMGPWATYFLQFGVATLVYDKRGVGASTGDWRGSSFETLAADAVAAVEFLTSRTDIDPTRIGLHGSSEGGWVTPIAAASCPAVSFLIVRAGPGEPAPKTVLHEMVWDRREKNLTDDELSKVLDLTSEIFDAARAGQDWTSLDSLIDPARGTEWYSKAHGTGRPRGASERYWGFTVANANIDPTAYLRELHIPILWFLAELDENVDSAASEPLLRAAFAAAPTDDHDLRVLAGANHAFFVVTDGVPAYTTGYWSAMAEWLQARGFTAP
ncbi:MAG: alpha/beta hydrolase [Candidatus Poribacteria bacterium]